MCDFMEKIIGYEDVKSELSIIKDMLVNPDVYDNMGASMMKGLLLHGRPGTGKTTMANCLIKASGWKSYVCRKKSPDGSFVEEIVKVFEEAKKNTPSIVFLDDLDKFSDSDSEEAEEFVTVQTCIDETAGKDVFVLATANKPRRLPDSLLRPGRLGKLIRVRNPRKDETVEIIRFYLDKAKVSKDLDMNSIAMMLQGESCAILEDVIRTAAVKAAFSRQDCITMNNIVDACLDLVFEASDLKKQYSDDTLRRTAYHEGGHAIVSELLDPGSVSIVSIRPTNSSTLGFVRYCRKEDEEIAFEYLENMLKTSLAGKAATEIVYGEPDIGANRDLHNAFDCAEKIADDFCSFGFQNWIQDNDTAVSAENRNRAMAMIMERNYMEVKRILARNRDLLDRIAEELLEKTTLVHADVERIMNDCQRKIA